MYDILLLTQQEIANYNLGFSITEKTPKQKSKTTRDTESDADCQRHDQKPLTKFCVKSVQQSNRFDFPSLYPTFDKFVSYITDQKENHDLTKEHYKSHPCLTHQPLKSHPDPSYL